MNTILRSVIAVLGGLGLAVALEGHVKGAQALELSCSETAGAIVWTAQGPEGAEFVVQGSADLKTWMPVFADRFGDVSCQFIDPSRTVSGRRFYRAVLGPPGLELAEPPARNAAPFGVLAWGIAGLDPAAGGIYARFFDDRGFMAEVPAIDVTSVGVEFPVPAYLVPQSGTLGSGMVSIQLIQRDHGAEAISRTVHNFFIEDLPRPAHPPGAVAAHFLEGAVTRAQELLEDLPDTPFDTPEMREALAGYVAQTADFLEIVREVTSTPSGAASLGSVADQPVVLTAQVLENLDRMVIGFLRAQGAGVSAAGLSRSGARGKIGNCARAEADGYATALLHDPDSAGQERASYYRAHSGCTAAPFATAYKVVGGAGGMAISMAVLAGAPAEALALASGALLYITAAGAGGLVALSGAMGQESAAAAEMLQTGVDLMEDVLRGPVKSAVDDMTGAVLDLAASVASLKEAFSAAPLNPPPTTGVRPSTVQLGSVGGCAGGALHGSVEVFAPAGVAWTVVCPDDFVDPIVELSSQSGMGPGDVSFSIVAAPQFPTPGFSCEDIGIFNFSSLLEFTFATGEFSSVIVEYQYLLVL